MAYSSHPPPKQDVSYRKLVPAFSFTKMELCLELCWMSNSMPFFVLSFVKLALFTSELIPSYSKGTMIVKKSPGKCFVVSLWTPQIKYLLTHPFSSNRRISPNPDLHLFQVRLPRDASLLRFLVQGLPHTPQLSTEPKFPKLGRDAGAK